MKQKTMTTLTKYIFSVIFALIFANATVVFCQPRTIKIKLFTIEKNERGADVDVREETVEIAFIDPIEFCTAPRQDNNLKLQTGKTYKFALINTTGQKIYISLVQGAGSSDVLAAGELFFSNEILPGKTYESEPFTVTSGFRVAVSKMRFDEKGSGAGSASEQESVGSVRGADGLTNFASLGAVAGSENTNYRELIKLYQKTLKESQMLPKACRARISNSLGVAHLAVSEFAEAIQAFKSALQYTGNNLNSYQFEYKRIEAAIYNNLGLAYSALGLQKEAAENYEKAAELKEAIKDFNGLSILAINLGVLAITQKDAERAAEYFQKATNFNNVFKSEESRQDQRQREQRKGLIFSGLARVESLRGNHRESISLSEQALRIAKASGNRAMEGFAYNNIGAGFRELNDAKKSIENYEQALIVFREVGNRAMEGIVLGNLMSAHRHLGLRKTAVFYGKQAINSFQELRAELKRSSDDFEQVLSKSSDTVKIKKQVIDRADDFEQVFLKSRADIYRKLADILIEEGLFTQARQVLKMLKTEEYAEFVRRDVKETEDDTAPVNLSEDERKLIEDYKKAADEVTKIGQEWTKLYKKNSEETLSTNEQKRYDELSVALNAANEILRRFLREQVVAKLKDASKKEKTRENIEFDRELQEELRLAGEGTVALYTVVDEDSYRVILTTPATQLDFQTVIPSAELNRKIFEFYEALNNPRIDPLSLGHDLYKILFPEKLLEALPKDTKTLVWSLDGQLRYIPFAALSPDGKAYLAGKYQNVIISAKTRNNLAGASADWRVLGMGVSDAQAVAHPVLPDKEIKFDKLDGTKEELIKIVRREDVQNETGYFAGDRFLNADFTKDVFTTILTKTENGRRKYTVVHFATHFYLGENDKDSFLLLGGGQKLTMADFIKEQRINFNNVELVTLSACNTGYGKEKAQDAEKSGKEIDSLAAFIEKRSAKSVMATLWAVADESTALFMSEFYRLKKENPQMTKAEAMQKVQIAMIEGKLKATKTDSGCRSGIYSLGDKPKNFECRENAPFSHPFFWSPFILIGNWR